MAVTIEARSASAPGRARVRWTRDRVLDLLAKTVVVKVTQRAAVQVSEIPRVAIAILQIVAPGRALAVVRAQDRRPSPCRTVGPWRTWHTLSVEPVVAVVRSACVVGVKPRRTLLTILADHVTRGVALVSYVRVTGSS